MVTSYPYDGMMVNRILQLHHDSKLKGSKSKPTPEVLQVMPTHCDGMMASTLAPLVPGDGPLTGGRTLCLMPEGLECRGAARYSESHRSRRGPCFLDSDP